MAQYDYFASVYDELMHEVRYDEIADFLLNAFDRFGRRPALALDVACGTGSLTVELARRGISMIGADISEQMLGIAMEKKYDSDCTDILLLRQSMQNLDLFGTIDGAVCCMDSINHIVGADNLQKGFDRVSFFMEKDALFIFDVNTPYKHKNILADNTFIYETEDIFCAWQNEYKQDGVVDITLDFFAKTESGEYSRKTEEFSEQSYSREQITQMLDRAGLELLAVFDGYSFDRPTDTTQREVYIARKREQTNGKAD